MIVVSHLLGRRMNFPIPLCRSFALLAALASASIQAEDGESSDQDREDGVEELVVVGSLDSLPGADVRGIYGFDKSILATPRSASTISEEMMDRYNMSDIDELIVAAPGTFTQSFFGVAGSLDIRGTIGETYFRGVRRLDNPGNYPTPIGASDRIDIVRGPASPIHGPSKIGGYLNFNPKSARIEETGEYIAERTGSVSLNVGSWDKRIVNAELGGPGNLVGQEFGYWLYAELEDSGSYYRNSGIDQTLVQASFDMSPTATLDLQFGGMVHDYTGNQVAGWNRLTQDLIDHGTYVTGSPASLDADGDGHISHQEFDIDGDGFTDLNPFAAGLVPGTTASLGPGPFPGACSIGETLVFGCLPDLLGLLDPGTGTLSGDQVLVAPDDTLENQVLTLYFDAQLNAGNGWEWRNQVFFETYENLNENDYGFSQFHDAWVFEDKLVLAKEFLRGETTTSVQLSPSLRYTSFEHADDYTNEYFDRRDLTQPQSALSRRLLSTEIHDDYTEYYIGEYMDLGIAALVDWSWRGVNALAGVRYDAISMESRQPVDKLLLASSNNFCLDESCIDIAADDDVGGVSWTASLSYVSDAGLVPYVTVSRQSTVIAGQGAEIATASIADGAAFDVSKLTEFGLKGSVLDRSLYFALAVYEQERTDYAAQQTVTNQATRTEGAEFEARWGRERQPAVDVRPLADRSGEPKHAGIGIPVQLHRSRRRAGNPRCRALRRHPRRRGDSSGRAGRTSGRNAGDDLLADWNLRLRQRPRADRQRCRRRPKPTSGYSSNSVLLPAYRLVNIGLGYQGDKWSLTVIAKNATDERYFRSNFPNLFGGVVVLPELPAHHVARIQYNW